MSLGTDLLCELIEVVIHNILYIRKIYPDSIYSRRRKYGIPVFQCIQPDVNNYINECLKAVRFHTKKNQLKRLHVCFQSGGSVTEKYTFEIIDIRNIVESDPLLINLEQYMRDFILRLYNTLHYLEDLSEDSTFIIQLQTTQYSNLEFNQDLTNADFPWVLANDSETALGCSDIIPVHSLISNILKLQIYIEKDSK